MGDYGGSMKGDTSQDIEAVDDSGAHQRKKIKKMARSAQLPQLPSIKSAASSNKSPPRVVFSAVLNTASRVLFDG